MKTKRKYLQCNDFHKTQKHTIDFSSKFNKFVILPTKSGGSSVVVVGADEGTVGGEVTEVAARDAIEKNTSFKWHIMSHSFLTLRCYMGLATWNKRGLISSQIDYPLSIAAAVLALQNWGCSAPKFL